MDRPIDLRSPAPLSVAEWTSSLSDAAIRARQRYALSAVHLDTPLLVVPLSGTKNVIHGARTFSARAGDYLMIHRALDLGIENIPAADGPYLAGTLAFPWPLVGLARQLVLHGSGLDAARFDGGVVSRNAIRPHLLAALRQYLDLVRERAAPALRDHALVGILVALHADGASGFLLADDPSLAARIRLAVGAQPRHAWSSADFEAMFHVSGATLRRRLAGEGSNLRTLVREARLQHALGLLQTTRKPLARVAEECGYRSVASFREGFIGRFGVDPAVVAND